MKRQQYFYLLNLVGVAPPVTRLAHTILLVLGVRLGIQREKTAARSREARSSIKAQRRPLQLRAAYSPTRGQSRDLSHAARASDLLLGGTPQQTVASVDHRETPQQFDKMATVDL